MSHSLDPIALIEEFVAVPAPPGQEEPLRLVVEAHVRALGYACETDAKGNLLVPLPGSAVSATAPKVIVTAHLDEIALMISGIEWNGRLSVVPLGGLYPWKWGEGPVEILTAPEPLPGVLSFGSIHTDSAQSVKEQAKSGPLLWEYAAIFTGLTVKELNDHGIRAGIRVVMAREKRKVWWMGDLIGSYFLDDRADLVAWLLALESLKGEEFPTGVLFAATVAEEVGGEGARYLMHRLQPDICLALEIGPCVPESPFIIDDQPTIWVSDSYAAMSPQDADLMTEVSRALPLKPHWQALSRGGSDASCSAQIGLTARPVTLGLPVENSHGFEVMHRNAPAQLARLSAAYLRRVAR